MLLPLPYYYCPPTLVLTVLLPLPYYYYPSTTLVLTVLLPLPYYYYYYYYYYYPSTTLVLPVLPPPPYYCYPTALLPAGRPTGSGPGRMSSRFSSPNPGVLTATPTSSGMSRSGST